MELSKSKNKLKKIEIFFKIEVMHKKQLLIDNKHFDHILFGKLA